jgi:two-component sensor histidine kinase
LHDVLLRYAIALAAFAAGLVLRTALDVWLSPDRGAVLFVPGIILATYLAGLGPAILTAVLSGLALWYIFVPPFYSFGLGREGAVTLGTLVFVSIVSITLVHWLRVTLVRLEAERARAETLAQQRQQAEQRIAADLLDTTRLNELANLLGREGGEVNDCLSAVVETAIMITGADKGNAQLFVPSSNALTIAAHRGFDEAFLSFFALVREDASACGAAMRSGERVIVENVMISEIFSGQIAQKTLIEAGVRAITSTPIMSSNRYLLGVISVHFSEPHRPNERELRFLDLLTRQAADYLERVHAKRMEQTLVHELEHRSNNLLSVVLSIATQTIPANARKGFQARLHALARSNRQVLKSNLNGVSLSEIVHGELEPFAERTVIEGVDVVLIAKQAQNVSLALHELATNAAKYGALSNGTGTIRVFWEITRGNANDTLQFKWQERGGPPTVAPTRRGFGTSLLKTLFVNAQMEYAVEGLNCEFDLRLDKLELDDTDAATLQ